MEIKTSSFFWDSSISSYSSFRRRSEFSINPNSYSSSSMRTLHSLFIILLDLVSSNPNVYDLQLEELRCYQLQRSNSRNNLTYLFSYLHTFTAVWKGKRWGSAKKKKWNAQGKIFFFRLHNMWLFSYFNVVTIFLKS